MKFIDFTVKNHFSGPVSTVIFRFYFLLSLLLFSLLFLVPIVVSVPAFAIEVEGLYQGSVPVSSRDNERERNRAFNEAFRQVLLKVTGNLDVFSQPQIRQAITNADEYVDTWSYATLPTTSSDDSIATEQAPDEELNVTFFEPEVLRLLDSAEISLWPDNRPYTLIWLVIQDELGQRELLGSSVQEYEDILTLLKTEADIRGLPILLPVLDIEDMRAVSADDVWDMNGEKLIQASSRYPSESVLVVRMFRALGGEVLGESNYLFRDQVLSLESFEESAEDFLKSSISMAANELSGYYAVLLSGTDSEIKVNLTVEGIHDAEDYAGLLNYVGRLTNVNAFQITSVDNESIELILSTGGQLRQLVETIALNRNLLPVSELVRENNQVYMSYQWNQ
ncbi:MAG: DUF2066 domain-containing protein [Gammaproteobacteria bacterium]|nr:DUF2066 domain-containing protein [Gammaproteobacteria bacterium]